jgi:glucose-6-phosphate isomerase
MWDWVGGRYSLWSAIGLPLALAIGIDNFREMLRGAHEMDEHFRTAPMEKNMPVIMALLGVWYVNFFGINSQAILPYDHYLRGLPAHLQQLDMESNGKSIGIDGRKVDYHTGPIIWGGVGSNGQHAYHQLLHQGTHFSPSDFIMPMRSHNPIDNFHAMLVSNALSQSQALLTGKTEQQAIDECLAAGMSEGEAIALAAQKVIPGNRPSNTLYFPKSTPHSVGALIALYEHKVAAQGMIWGVNSFDQWGVELGKDMGNNVLAALEGRANSTDFDSSTSGLVQAYKKMQDLL